MSAGQTKRLEEDAMTATVVQLFPAAQQPPVKEQTYAEAVQESTRLERAFIKGMLTEYAMHLARSKPLTLGGDREQIYDFLIRQLTIRMVQHQKLLLSELDLFVDDLIAKRQL